MMEIESKFFIDTGRVIAAVCARPNIWNPADDDYKNSFKRAKSWNAICHEALDHFDQYVPDDQRELEKRVQQRWRTARDCFVKTRTRPATKRAGRTTKGPQYVFMKQLSFLEPTLRHPRPLPSAIKQQKPTDKHCEKISASSYITEALVIGRQCSSDDVSTEMTIERTTEALLVNIRPRPTVKLVQVPQTKPEPTYSADGMSPFERQLLQLLQRTQSPLEDDDESFFRSLAPVMAALDPHHKLLFRSRVLATALDIQSQCNSVFLEAPPMCDVDLQEDEPLEKKYRPSDADTSSNDSTGPK